MQGVDILLNEHATDEQREIVNPQILMLFSIYTRCRKFANMALPQEGGLLDQDDVLLHQLEIIHDVVVKWEGEQQEDQISKMQQQARVSAVQDKHRTRTRRG